MELRIADGANLTKKDVVNALKAFERFFESYQYVATAGFDLRRLLARPSFLLRCISPTAVRQFCRSSVSLS